MTVVASYTDRAVQVLRKIGIVLKAESDAPVITLLNAISELDNKRVTAIARTLQQQSAFNSVVRDNIMGMEIANRQSKIVAGFDSIRSDAQQMAIWLEDDKLDFIERIQHAWMIMWRGSIPDRFELIRKNYLEVAKDAGDQITRERSILEAYQDYRLGLKQAEIDSHEIFKVASDRVEQSKEALRAAQATVEQYQGTDDAHRSLLELQRDEALRYLQQQDERYQIVKDLSDNLIVAYNSAESIFARLQQTSSVKERVYRQSITFFSTNEIVFTAISASMTSMSGLSESTKTLEAMKDGINKGLESLATESNQKLEAGLRAGYGSTIKADSIRSLVNAINTFQESSYRLIDELRLESTNNALELERVVEDGKKRFSDIVLKAEMR